MASFIMAWKVSSMVEVVLGTEDPCQVLIDCRSKFLFLGFFPPLATYFDFMEYPGEGDAWVVAAKKGVIFGIPYILFP